MTLTIGLDHKSYFATVEFQTHVNTVQAISNQKHSILIQRIETERQADWSRRVQATFDFVDQIRVDAGECQNRQMLVQRRLRLSGGHSRR